MPDSRNRVPRIHPVSSLFGLDHQQICTCYRIGPQATGFSRFNVECVSNAMQGTAFLMEDVIPAEVSCRSIAAAALRLPMEDVIRFYKHMHEHSSQI